MSKRVTFAHVFYLQASPVFLVQWSQVPACHKWFSDFFWNAPLQELKYSLFPMPHNFLSIIKCKKGSKMYAIWTKKDHLWIQVFLAPFPQGAQNVAPSHAVMVKKEAILRKSYLLDIQW